MNKVIQQLESIKKASRQMNSLDDDTKKNILRSLSVLILENKERIKSENKKDLDRMDDADPKKDRLLLNDARIEDLAKSLLDVANLPDPTGIVLSDKVMPNGLSIQKITAPLGVVGVIYESRPNVTIDVAALCIRSGNGVALRGGTDAFYSNTCLVSLIHRALENNDISPDAIQLLPTEREYVKDLLEAVKYVDIIIPRGSEQLINFVRSNSKVPTIETGAGVCHTYVHSDADLNKAAEIVVNAKVSRPSVCNALDTIIVDKKVSKGFLPKIVDGMKAFDVIIHADEASYLILKNAGYPYLKKANEEDFGREFLGFSCSVKTVENYDEAVQHISEYSSKHSEAIITENKFVGEKFLKDIDAAAVYINASTRFTDGGVFGLGAEIGISTQKLHARGPFALEKLVTEKWLVRGDGQIR